MIKSLAEIVFYLILVILALYSLVMVYALLRFGQSRTLGFVISGLYLIIMFSLFIAAMANFQLIPFSDSLFL